jgi:hypothetical protein
MEKNMNLPDEIYIVVSEFDDDQKHTHLRMTPVAWETDLDMHCSKAEAIKRANRLRTLYGHVKIGRLVFDTDETLDLSDAMTPEEKAQIDINKEVTQ